MSNYCTVNGYCTEHGYTYVGSTGGCPCRWYYTTSPSMDFQIIGPGGKWPPEPIPQSHNPTLDDIRELNRHIQFPMWLEAWGLMWVAIGLALTCNFDEEVVRLRQEVLKLKAQCWDLHTGER
jgi:hypothetical protein